jgi:hypothetical protein
MSQHAQRYLETARRDPILPQERPKEFVISCSFFWGYQGHLGHLESQTEAVASIGINTVNVQEYTARWPGLPALDINEVLGRYGVTGRSQAVYRPFKANNLPKDVTSDDVNSGLTMFGFYLQSHQQALDSWVTDQAQSSPPNADGSVASVVQFALSDEPAWSISAIAKAVSQNSTWLQVFRTYLETNKLTPMDFDKTTWGNVLPSDTSLATATLGERRLFYWTMRFLQHSASQGHALVREALEKAFERPLFVFPNWNYSRWLLPEKGMLGCFDWFTSGRTRAHTLWTRDGFPDQDAQTWSTLGDMLRSLQMLGSPRDQEFGGYVDGGFLGNHPAGASYKILSLVGHGAKIVDLYAFGPIFFQADGWSENTTAYAAIARALSLVGRAERLLYPGRPERGKVAILSPAASSLWDPTDTNNLKNPKYYEYEPIPLHYALVHAGYTVDFVDDVDIAQGELSSRGYTTLYVTSPNVSAAAQTKIPDWIQKGGTLVATLGAGVADEYNESTSNFRSMLGLKTWRHAVRDWRTVGGGEVKGTLRFTDPTSYPAFGTDLVPLLGPVSVLEPDGASVVANLFNVQGVVMGPSITVNALGKGCAVAYGFFLGTQYSYSPDRTDPQRLPLRWGKAQRDLVAAPVRHANTSRLVLLSNEVVEACRLQSENGIAVVLLNWTDEPISNLGVTLADPGNFKRVSSAQGVTLTSSITARGLHVQMPLKDVDVVIVE